MRIASGARAGVTALLLTGCAGTWDFPDTMQVRDASAPSPDSGARLTGSGAGAVHCLENEQRKGQNGFYLPLHETPCAPRLPPGTTSLRVDGALDKVTVVVPQGRPVDLELVAPSSANRALTAVSYGSLVASGTAAIPVLVGVYGKQDAAFTVAGFMLTSTLFTFSTTHLLAEAIGPGRIRFRDPATGVRRPDERSVELGTAMNLLLLFAGAAATAGGVGILAHEWPNVDTPSERLTTNVMGTSLFALASVPFSFALSNALHAKDGNP